MKSKSFFALSALLIGGLTFASCSGGVGGPKTSLKSSLDSISYAYGVDLANQGLIDYLAQSGVLESPQAIDFEYQSKIAQADSTQKAVLEKEYKAKLDSLNKKNAPKLDQFIKGLKESFKDGEENAAYAQGLSIGQQISKQMLPQFNSLISAEDSTKKLNNDQILAGLISLLKNEKLAIEKIEAGEIVKTAATEAQEKAQKKQEEDLKIQYKDSIAAGEKFLADNAKRPEVVTLPSGLQYEIIKKGNGPIPTASDKVKVNYHGTLINGTVFDSSVQRGEPVSFAVTGVIKGWTEALELMPVGSKWKLYVPYDLAYGAQDRGAIKPFSTLIFDVDLLSIEK